MATTRVNKQTGEVYQETPFAEPQDYQPDLDSSTEGAVEPDSQTYLPVHLSRYVTDPARTLLHVRYLPPHHGDKKVMLNNARMYADYVETPTKPLRDYAGQVITVCGAIVREQGPYSSFKEPEKIEDGYLEVRLKLTATEEVKLMHGDTVKKVQRHIILRTSGTRVMELMGGLLPALGWYDWDCNIEFEVGLDNGGHGAIFLRMI